MFTQVVNIVWDAGGGTVIYDQNPSRKPSVMPTGLPAISRRTGTSTRPRMVAS